ncbi:hypothetical protein DYB31_000509 [Aphanomyces astaci]|uniref:RING-type domain-containing protein n=1 Tax=Aphanomyces astaci TaxID=112090 RepID=A0A397F9T4_APHAT|nr:hypothetical protein DYB31_000509 [Aphanomyces astaci]
MDIEIAAPSLHRRKPTDDLHVDCSDAVLAKSSEGVMSPATACSSSDGDDTCNVFVCDVCFEECDLSDGVKLICGRSCSATMCTACTHTYITVRTASVIPGVLAKLNCPTCLVPVNLRRWHNRLAAFAPKFDDVLSQFCDKVERSCDVKCPSCHINRSQLPPHASSVPPIKMLPTLAAHIPRLRELGRAYCNHQLSAADVVAFAQTTFGQLGDIILEYLVQLIDDRERRATLYLRLRRTNPLILTLCCNAAVCFSCHVAGHHDGGPCGGVAPTDQVVECESCGLHLVKGDGCDWVQCYCGLEFGWTSAAMATKMRRLEPRHLAALRCMIQPFRRLVFKRKLFRQVLSKVPELHLAARQRSIEAELSRNAELKLALRYRLCRWVQRIRKHRVFRGMMSDVLVMQAKYFWVNHWATHADEWHELDDETSSFMAMDV